MPKKATAGLQSTNGSMWQRKPRQGELGRLAEWAWLPYKSDFSGPGGDEMQPILQRGPTATGGKGPMAGCSWACWNLDKNQLESHPPQDALSCENAELSWLWEQAEIYQMKVTLCISDRAFFLLIHFSFQIEHVGSRLVHVMLSPVPFGDQKPHQAGDLGVAGNRCFIFCYYISDDERRTSNFHGYESSRKTACG